MNDEKRLYFRIKHAATSNYRGSVFLPSRKKRSDIYVPIRPSQPSQWTMNYKPWTMNHVPFTTKHTILRSLPPMLAHLLFCRGHPFDEILLYTCRGLSTNQPFYAKQTQFPKKSNDVNSYNTTDYERKRDWTLGENKPNLSQFKPIKANFKANQSQSKPI